MIAQIYFKLDHPPPEYSHFLIHLSEPMSERGCKDLDTGIFLSTSDFPWPLSLPAGRQGTVQDLQAVR